MSRQRNIDRANGPSNGLIESEEPDFVSVHKDHNIFQLDKEFDLLKAITRTFKITFLAIYNITPFFILVYLLQIYRSPIIESFYHPDLPNSFHEASVAELNEINVEFYDLVDYASTAKGWQNDERVLFLVPLRDASAHLPMFFSHLANLTYPHHLIDLSFLISDTSDSTIEDLDNLLREFQSNPDKEKRFGRIEIFEKDFGQIVGQSFSDRHGFAAQGPRRKKMAIARNWLLSTALKPDHSWVYWRDIDVETCPATILEDLMHHDKDVIVPNIWRPLPDWLGYEQAYDLNSWQESEGGVELAERLDEDAVIVEGYPEYATWRPHLAYLRDPYGDPEVEVELDGIGGVSILAKAEVFRRGAMFPAFSFKKHAETEAFGKLCKTMGFQVIGLPHYVIWHIYEPSTDDLKHMEWLADEELRQKENLRNKVVFDRAWKLAFEDVSDKWVQEKFDIFKNTDLSSLKLGSVDWDEVDEYLAEVDEDAYETDDQEKKKDDGFLVSFDSIENKNFEENVLKKLGTGPIAFGDSKHEVVFSNFKDSNGKRKKMNFRKFTKVVEDDSSNIQDDKEEKLEGKYDLASDQIVKDTKESELKEEINDNTINNDKQLFSNLESNKNEIDGEEEGGVEFKEQQLVEEAEAEAKVKKQQLKEKAKKLSNVIRKTLYGVDEDGVTVTTIVNFVTPTQKLTEVKQTAKAVKKDQGIIDEVNYDEDVKTRSKKKTIASQKKDEPSLE